MTKLIGAIARTTAFVGILLAVSGMFGFSTQTLIGFGRTPGYQDPYAQPPYVSPDPDNLDFGDQVVRRTSAAKRIIIKNTGGKPLFFDGVEIRGDNPNSFAIFKDTCTGATVDPQRSCIIDVTFTPTRTGGRNARLKMTSNAINGPQRLRLKGNGINASAVPPF